ncbi:hypothetical protein C1H46_010006 [Malus baccata]|uniref:Uncharacterized protein n=1 Tax=Malus baccata TaxID=106549 RepID=A0A540N004_MALBA|nr:hypothetical protein C1H46_010006 [Malus baccata]
MSGRGREMEVYISEPSSSPQLPTPTVFLFDLFAKIFSVSAAAATTLPQRNMNLLRSLCNAAHFPPKSHLKLFQFRTRDARKRDEKLGGRLYNEFCYCLNKKQVFAVLEEDFDSKRPIKIEDPEGVLK